MPLREYFIGRVFIGLAVLRGPPVLYKAVESAQVSVVERLDPSSSHQSQFVC
jgi:hypothetical protein